jgi:hypothetical protein
MKNLIKGNTCFKGETPTALDVFLSSNSYMYVKDNLNVDIGLSDCHNLIGCALKAHAPQKVDKVIKYRSFKSFDQCAFLDELNHINFNSCFIHSNMDDTMHSYNTLYTDVLDKHAPIKTKRIKKIPPPFMNHDLRKAIYRKCMLRNKYYKNRCDANWELYKKQRNYVTKLRKQSIRNYFINKTNGVRNSNDFWKIMRPFITDKNSISDDKIILREEDNLITDTLHVCNVLNKYFTQVASTIGFEDSIPNIEIDASYIDIVRNMYKNHPSIKEICKQNIISKFEFSFTTDNEVQKIITGLDLKKSMGYDYISPKILKISSTCITPIITKLINRCIELCIFPSDLKLAEVASIFKKSDKLNKENYRPISVLVILSKVFEKILSSRMNIYFNDIFSPYLSAYRQNYNCEQVLVKFISTWKQSLDENKYFGAVLMDLSKAFDCLPHNLIIAKLHAYGFTYNSCLLIASYLSHRKQRVKIGSSRSEWLPLDKGVPQGSILGPILFNIFINDIFYFISFCTLLNYADDNTVIHASYDVDDLVNNLSYDSNVAVQWFVDNGMQANPAKFQAIISHRHMRAFKAVPIGNKLLEPQQSVKLLGITFDIDLSFETHTSNLCKKASRSLNVLKRFSKILSVSNKTKIFHTFISSQFNYCPIIWHFCSKRKLHMIEKIQERALRFIFNDTCSNYTDLLKRVRKDTMLTQRLKGILVFVYKCVNKLGPTYLNALFHVKVNLYNIRNDILVVQPKVNTVTNGINSIVYHGARMWNLLPKYIKEAQSVQQFKFLLKKFTKPLCVCSHCTDRLVLKKFNH